MHSEENASSEIPSSVLTEIADEMGKERAFLGRALEEVLTANWLLSQAYAWLSNIGTNVFTTEAHAEIDKLCSLIADMVDLKSAPTENGDKEVFDGLFSNKQSLDYCSISQPESFEFTTRPAATFGNERVNVDDNRAILSQPMTPLERLAVACLSFVGMEENPLLDSDSKLREMAKQTLAGYPPSNFAPFVLHYIGDDEESDIAEMRAIATEITLAFASSCHG